MWWGRARARGRGDEFFTNRFYCLLSNEGEYQKDNIWFLARSALGSSVVSVLLARAHVSLVCFPYALVREAFPPLQSPSFLPELGCICSSVRLNMAYNLHFLLNI